MMRLTLDGAVFEIVPDESPESPRDWDNLGTMVCWHRRYALGDRHDFCDPQAFAASVPLRSAIILPLYLMDHSGLTLRTGSADFRACDPAGWDWGQVGYIYATHDSVRREFGVRRLTRAVRARAEDVLAAEVIVYDQYLRGEVYGYTLTDHISGEMIDSCWGFYGDDPRANSMLDYLPEVYHDAILAYLEIRAA